MKVECTSNSTVTYCVSEGEDDFFYTVHLRGSEVTEIKIPCDTTARLSARILLHLRRLLEQLEKDGYTLAYKPIE